MIMISSWNCQLDHPGSIVSKLSPFVEPDIDMVDGFEEFEVE